MLTEDDRKKLNKVIFLGEISCIICILLIINFIIFAYINGGSNLLIASTAVGIILSLINEYRAYVAVNILKIDYAQKNMEQYNEN